MISTSKHVDYALGYIELGLLKEARAELALIKADDHETAPVLTARLELAMASESWARVIPVASRLTNLTPEVERPWVAWAYALRELQAVGDALDVLMIGESQIHKPSALVDYNLACYHCLMGEMSDARRRLKRACSREPSWEAEAAADPDLAALHADAKKPPRRKPRGGS